MDFKMSHEKEHYQVCSHELATSTLTFRQQVQVEK